MGELGKWSKIKAKVPKKHGNVKEKKEGVGEAKARQRSEKPQSAKAPITNKKPFLCLVSFDKKIFINYPNQVE